MITSNDRYVNEAWRTSIEQRMDAKMTLTMLSDADGAALRALGLVDALALSPGPNPSPSPNPYPTLASALTLLLPEPLALARALSRSTT